MNKYFIHKSGATVQVPESKYMPDDLWDKLHYESQEVDYFFYLQRVKRNMMRMVETSKKGERKYWHAKHLPIGAFERSQPYYS